MGTSYLLRALLDMLAAIDMLEKPMTYRAPCAPGHVEMERVKASTAVWLGPDGTNGTKEAPSLSTCDKMVGTFANRPRT